MDRLTPFHQGFIRELRTTTALQCSAAWLVSENVRAIRQARDEYVYVLPTHPSMQKQIDEMILLSGVKASIERMN